MLQLFTIGIIYNNTSITKTILFYEHFRIIVSKIIKQFVRLRADVFSINRFNRLIDFVYKFLR